MRVDFSLICLKYLGLPCSCGWLYPPNIKRYIIVNLLRLYRIYVTPAHQMKCPSCKRGSVFGCQGFLLSIYSITKTRCLPLPWRKFPICHYSQHAPLPLALYFRVCPWAGQGTLENNAVVKVCNSQVSFPQSAMLAGCCFTFYTLRARNNCGSRCAHLAFRSVIWIRGNAFHRWN